MAISSLGDNIFWSDIENACTQDPDTYLWSGNTVAIADALNDDYRHVNNITVAIAWEAIWGELELVSKDLGVGADPANDDYQWLGLFDTYHRDLTDTGTVNKLQKSYWNKMLTRGPNVTADIYLVPDYTPKVNQQDDRRQRSGLVFAKWNEACQDLVILPEYLPVLSTKYKDDQQAVYDLWIELTGGRRFGACTLDSVQDVIDAQNVIETNKYNRDGTADVRGRAEAAVAAANASFQAGNDQTTIIADGDAAYATPL